MSEHAAEANSSTSPAPEPPPPDGAREFGEQVGRVAALALRQLEGLAAAGMAQARAAAAPDAAESLAPRESGGQGTGRDASPAATARAEELVSRAGALLGAMTAGTSEHVQQAAALAREEAEDIWAEAQQLRARSHHEPHQTP